MKQQLSTELKTHIVIFKDRSEVPITKIEYDALFSSIHEFVRLAGQTYSKNMIAKAITMDEYYTQYPEKNPPKYGKSESLDDEVAKYKSMVDTYVSMIEKENKKEARHLVNWPGGNCSLFSWEYYILIREGIITDDGIKNMGNFYIFNLAKKFWKRKKERQEWATKQNQPPIENYG